VGRRDGNHPVLVPSERAYWILLASYSTFMTDTVKDINQVYYNVPPLSWSLEVIFGHFHSMLRKVTTAFLMSLGPSIHLHGTTSLPLNRFSWTFIVGILWKPIDKIWIWLELEKPTDTLHGDVHTFTLMSCCWWVKYKKYCRAREAEETVDPNRVWHQQ
jgi:hypothetical protein